MKSSYRINHNILVNRCARKDLANEIDLQMTLVIMILMIESKVLKILGIITGQKKFSWNFFKKMMEHKNVWKE